MTNHIYCPIEVLTDSEITDSERKVLLALYSFRNKNTELCCPSVELIQDRANINDRARVGKITTSLAKKGWVKKKKIGFSGRNNYVVSVPERLLTSYEANYASNAPYEAKYTSRMRQNIPHHMRQNIPNTNNSNINKNINIVNKSIKKRSITETLNDRSWALND